MTGSRDKIFIHHVGGRGGSFDFPLSDKFNDDLCIYLYDMDEN